MRSLLKSMSKTAALLAVVSCFIGSAGAESPKGGDRSEESLARLTDQSRSDTYNDFMRVIWVDHGISVTEITRGRRAFFTATSFVNPSVTVDELLSLVGNYFRLGQDFVVMRCKPSPEQRSKVQPLLATWPNAFAAIAADLGGPNHDCSGLTVGEKQICDLAIQYQDSLQKVYSEGLKDVLQRGFQMFATTESTAALKSDYGIFPAFSGLGFAVQASATNTGATVEMMTADILRNLVVPEYLLKYALLAESGCRCIQVPATDRLHKTQIDPDFVWAFGRLNNGACRQLERL